MFKGNVDVDIDIVWNAEVAMKFVGNMVWDCTVELIMLVLLKEVTIVGIDVVVNRLLTEEVASLDDMIDVGDILMVSVVPSTALAEGVGSAMKLK